MDIENDLDDPEVLRKALENHQLPVVAALATLQSMTPVLENLGLSDRGLFLGYLSALLSVEAFPGETPDPVRLEVLRRGFKRGQELAAAAVARVDGGPNGL